MSELPRLTMPQVKNVVFLMLENRSLDNLLGWLYEKDNPQRVFPENSSKVYDGLQTGPYSNPAYDRYGNVVNYPVTKIPGGLGSNADRMPYYDPNEEMFSSSIYWNGVMNQLFGNQDAVSNLPSAPTVAGMKGFLQDYYTKNMLTYQGLDILWTYTPEDLPVINGLARCYAVSDRWLCSVPSQTNPNRAYSICGTSLGRESNLHYSAVETFDANTIFNSLAGAGKSLGLYYTDVWKDGMNYTEYTFPHIQKITHFDCGNANPVPPKQIEVCTIGKFFQRANNGTLPAFTYLEPQWGYGWNGFAAKQGTDYHPPTHLQPGEAFLAQVYSAVSNSKQWNQTLLIVTFDEHGGTYDHFAPPWSATNPDGLNGPSGFMFNFFGARVPTILISPFAYPSTVFRAPVGDANPYNLPFDHTSFIKTLLMWAGVDPNTAGFGKRMPKAPAFDYVLASTPVNQEKCVLKQSKPPAAAVGGEQVFSALPDESLDSLFEGVPFAVVKAILGADPNQSFSAIRAEIKRYRSDPEKFESLLKAAAGETRTHGPR